MNITKNINGETTIVSISGRLDTATASEFESFINENLDNAGNLTLDCKELAYISSAGLRVLLSIQKKMKNSMKLINVCELVMEVFEMTGFADILVIE
jgi:anti-sigma B factor antagonist